MEPPSTCTITILNETGRGVRTGQIKRAASVALDQHGCRDAQVSVLLTGDQQLRDLNHRYRGIDQATDVLTFPAGEFAGGSLGDIAISLPFAERQAKARRVSLSQELAYLAIHGALHLVGFDDETDRQRAEMVREMNRAAVAAGLKPDAEWASILHGEGAA